MSWSKNCIISKISRTAEACGDNPVEETLTIEATFQIKNAKHYVPVVTLSINDNFIFFFFWKTKQEFYRTIYWNKYLNNNPTQNQQFRLYD